MKIKIQKSDKFSWCISFVVFQRRHRHHTFVEQAIPQTLKIYKSERNQTYATPKQISINTDCELASEWVNAALVSRQNNNQRFQKTNNSNNNFKTINININNSKQITNNNDTTKYLGDNWKIQVQQKFYTKPKKKMEFSFKCRSLNKYL